MKLTYETDDFNVITKSDWSAFYDMCTYFSEQGCFCEHVPDGEKCLCCHGKEFLKD